ncbi:4-hydroxy-2-oxovalerate aldolase [Sphingopyxis lindanitolerans]|uniref:4-hydroxy-2-oxovalerate aldolase n=1 Tax=Sphingopyxis lindanitolerans TaxID=2054227 RepID=A0A2S8B1S1_9SPHN|nr:aldolase/citrate lyase family protein [Sphingopyxis lindanitolerans]PQM26290.1 4-hydroxy-2-oxovalerate aldolase [Sphingopyxis lindanitolerans]
MPDLGRVSDELRKGVPQIGSFISIPNTAVIEIAGCSGLDFVVLDAEHGLFDRTEIENLVRAADVAGLSAIVRVPDIRGGWIATALDVGAAGVVVPHVNTVADARAAVDQCRYPPDGKRGVGGGRATLFGARLASYLGTANSQILVAVQIETAEGLANVEAIAAVDGIDVIFVGPADLAVSLGVFREVFGSAVGADGKTRLDVAIAAIAAAARSHGRQLGTFVPQASEIDRWTAAGFHFLILGSDVGMLTQSYATLLRGEARQ